MLGITVCKDVMSIVKNDFAPNQEIESTKKTNKQTTAKVKFVEH